MSQFQTVEQMQAEIERLRELLEHIRGRILEPQSEAKYATQDDDIARWINDALQPEEGEL
jgi:hypothetical protein